MSLKNRGSPKHQCKICNLTFTTENDAYEHSWSLLHHKTLENSEDNPEKSLHHCKLCREVLFGLLSFVRHIEGEKHQKNLSDYKRKANTQMLRQQNGQQQQQRNQHASHNYQKREQQRNVFIRPQLAQQQNFSPINGQPYRQQYPNNFGYLMPQNNFQTQSYGRDQQDRYKNYNSNSQPRFNDMQISYNMWTIRNHNIYRQPTSSMKNSNNNAASQAVPQSSCRRSPNSNENEDRDRQHSRNHNKQNNKHSKYGGEHEHVRKHNINIMSSHKAIQISEKTMSERDLKRRERKEERRKERKSKENSSRSAESDNLEDKGSGTEKSSSSTGKHKDNCKRDSAQFVKKIRQNLQNHASKLSTKDSSNKPSKETNHQQPTPVPATTITTTQGHLVSANATQTTTASTDAATPTKSTTTTVTQPTVEDISPPHSPVNSHLSFSRFGHFTPTPAAVALTTTVTESTSTAITTTVSSKVTSPSISTTTTSGCEKPADDSIVSDAGNDIEDSEALVIDFDSDISLMRFKKRTEIFPSRKENEDDSEEEFLNLTRFRQHEKNKDQTKIENSKYPKVVIKDIRLAIAELHAANTRILNEDLIDNLKTKDIHSQKLPDNKTVVRRKPVSPDDSRINFETSRTAVPKTHVSEAASFVKSTNLSTSLPRKTTPVPVIQQQVVSKTSLISEIQSTSEVTQPTLSANKAMVSSPPVITNRTQSSVAVTKPTSVVVSKTTAEFSKTSSVTVTKSPLVAVSKTNPVNSKIASIAVAKPRSDAVSKMNLTVVSTGPFATLARLMMTSTTTMQTSSAKAVAASRFMPPKTASTISSAAHATSTSTTKPSENTTSVFAKSSLIATNVPTFTTARVPANSTAVTNVLVNTTPSTNSLSARTPLHRALPEATIVIRATTIPTTTPTAATTASTAATPNLSTVTSSVTTVDTPTSTTMLNQPSPTSTTMLKQPSTDVFEEKPTSSTPRHIRMPAMTLATALTQQHYAVANKSASVSKKCSIGHVDCQETATRNNLCDYHAKAVEAVLQVYQKTRKDNPEIDLVSLVEKSPEKQLSTSSCSLSNKMPVVMATTSAASINSVTRPSTNAITSTTSAVVNSTLIRQSETVDEPTTSSATVSIDFQSIFSRITLPPKTSRMADKQRTQNSIETQKTTSTLITSMVRLPGITSTLTAPHTALSSAVLLCNGAPLSTVVSCHATARTTSVLSDSLPSNDEQPSLQINFSRFKRKPPPPCASTMQLAPPTKKPHTGSRVVFIPIHELPMSSTLRKTIGKKLDTIRSTAAPVEKSLTHSSATISNSSNPFSTTRFSTTLRLNNSSTKTRFSTTITTTACLSTTTTAITCLSSANIPPRQSPLNTPTSTQDSGSVEFNIVNCGASALEKQEPSNCANPSSNYHPLDNQPIDIQTSVAAAESRRKTIQLNVSKASEVMPEKSLNIEYLNGSINKEKNTGSRIKTQPTEKGLLESIVNEAKSIEKYKRKILRAERTIIKNSENLSKLRQYNCKEEEVKNLTENLKTFFDSNPKQGFTEGVRELLKKNKL